MNETKMEWDSDAGDDIKRNAVFLKSIYILLSMTVSLTQVSQIIHPNWKASVPIYFKLYNSQSRQLNSDLNNW